jgi:hypothetical protein
MMVIIKINKQIKITNFSFFSAGSEIYDDAEDFEEISSSPSSTTSFSQSKLTANITSHLPAHAEEAQKHDYEEESDSYQNDINDDETTNQDDSQVFGDTMSVNRPDLKPGTSSSNNKKGSDVSSTSRIPFVPSNIWRDLFSKPGILVGKLIVI